MTRKQTSSTRPAEAEERLKEALCLAQLEKRPAGWRQLETARHFMRCGQLDSAELCLDTAIRQSLDKKPLLILLLIAKAELTESLSQFGRAIQYLDKASALAQETADHRSQGAVHAKQGDISSAQKDWLSALGQYRLAANRFAAAGELNGEAQAYLNAGQMAFRLFRFSDALKHYRTAADRASENLLISVHARLGVIAALTALSRWSEALERCQEIETEIRRLPGREDAREALLHVVQSKKALNVSLLGDDQQAYELQCKQITSYGSARHRAIAAAELAEIEFLRGSPERALSRERESEFFRRGLDADLPEALLPLSRLNLSRGHVHTADQQLFEAAIELPADLSPFERLPYDLHKVHLLTSQAKIAPATALAEELRTTLSNVDPQPAVLTNILDVLGQISLLRGDSAQALSLYQQSLDLATGLCMPLARSFALSGLARCMATQGDYESAERHVQEALSLVQKTPMKFLGHTLLLQRGELLVRANKASAEEAISQLSDLLMEGYSFESVSLDLQASLSLGLLCWQESREPVKAVSYLEETWRTAETHGLVLIELLSKGLLGGLLQDIGDHAQAEDLLGEVLARMEDLDLQLPVGDDFEERYRDLTGFQL